jgi:transcription elongation factor GreA
MVAPLCFREGDSQMSAGDVDMTEQKRVPLTQQAYDRLKEELAYLEGEGRTKVIDEIARARAHGDLSENAEYHAAKDQQGIQEARRRQVRHMLENAEIIRDDDDVVVKPGKLVTIRYTGDGEPETYLLGLREEKGGDHDVLTPESPIGQVLVGHGPGETVTATVPAGDLEIEIVAVRTP